MNKLPPKPSAPPAPPPKHEERWPPLEKVRVSDFHGPNYNLRILSENQEKIYSLLKEIATKLY